MTSKLPRSAKCSFWQFFSFKSSIQKNCIFCSWTI